jgi:cation:H+ antiporter
MQMAVQFLLLILGFVMLVKGADWFVEGASAIAEKFGIPELVVGLTIAAMGTSAPEAAVSITSALKGSTGITIGNVVGSNILNVLIILGVTSVITAVAVAKSTVNIEIPFVIIISILLLIMGYTGGRISFWEGVILWIVFLAYLAYLLWMAKTNGVQEEENKEKNDPLWKLLLLTVVGLVLVVWGSDVTVDAATEIARQIGFSERLIGLTIVALGTSLPELFTSVTAARKGKPGLAVGNIVGSNVFNILFVVGTTALITPVAFDPAFLVDMAVAVASCVVLWLCVLRNRKLDRPGGCILLAGYAVYFIYLIR